MYCVNAQVIGIILYNAQEDAGASARESMRFVCAISCYPRAVLHGLNVRPVDFLLRRFVKSNFLAELESLRRLNATLIFVGG